MASSPERLFKNGEFRRCLSKLSRLPKLNSDQMLLMARCYYRLELYYEADDMLKQLQNRHPGWEDIHYRRGLVFDATSQHARALQCYERALSIRSEEVSTLMNCAAAQLKLGQTSKAHALYEKVLKLDPERGVVYRSMGRCHHYQSLGDPVLLQMLSLLQSPTLDSKNRLQLHFALGKAFNDLQHYHRAFFHYQQGNALIAETRPFNLEKRQQRLLQEQRIFSAGYLQKLTQNRGSGRRHVFVIGLPRSGKSLVEKILGCWPQVRCLDEPAIVEKLLDEGEELRQRGYLEWCGSLNPADAAAMAERYMHHLKIYNVSGSDVLVDTTPTHFKHLGLLYAMFPAAHFIFVSRQPLDQVLQIYFQYFANGNRFAFDLLPLAHYYRFYLEHMNRWQAQLPAQVHEVEYEEMVRQPLQVAGHLAHVCGLVGDDGKGVHSLDWHFNEVQLSRHYEDYLHEVAGILDTSSTQSAAA